VRARLAGDDPERRCVPSRVWVGADMSVQKSPAPRRAANEGRALLARYQATSARRERVGWHEGPSNAIDRLIDSGYGAVEIEHRLGIERWVVQERFAARTVVES
jgi:hypothetical protein